MEVRLGGLSTGELDEEQAEVYRAIHWTNRRWPHCGPAGCRNSPEPAERGALGATRALLRHGTLNDDEYADAVAATGERGVFELTTLVGCYSMPGLQLRVFLGEGSASGSDDRGPQPLATP
ncbi:MULTISPECIES: hypothetical protein [Streptomyces]|jgi:hypothetical protein|uniref:Carboxymuconolactone decarboxylase family protein n=1 Tax=Streptomyces sp. 900129855 TaxID=3155129 RepID=A0ABV2ZU13_9ACTN